MEIPYCSSLLMVVSTEKVNFAPLNYNYLMKKTIFLFTYLLTLLTLGSCDEFLEKITVETIPASDVEYDSAVLHGNVSVKGSPTIREIGFFYGTTPNPTLRVQVSNLNSMPFSAYIKNLKENTKYYFQAYAIDGNNNVIKGEEFSFVTKPMPSVTIDYLTMKRLGMTSDYLTEYEMQGVATLQHEGYKVAHAGFIFSVYYGLNASDVISPDGATKIQCEIKGDKIALDNKTSNPRNIDNGSTYFLAYMILENGKIFTSETRKVTAYD